MRYKSDHNAKAKTLILEAAGQRFRQEGFGGIGIDGLMASVGMTSGAFYSKFDGKQDLIVEVVKMGLDKVLDKLSQDEGGHAALQKFLKHYFSEKHCLNVEGGCFMPALTVDVARANHEVKTAFCEKVKGIVSQMAESMKGEREDERRKRAWGLLSMMVGALALARAMPDYAQAHEVLENALNMGESWVQGGRCSP